MCIKLEYGGPNKRPNLDPNTDLKTDPSMSPRTDPSSEQGSADQAKTSGIYRHQLLPSGKDVSFIAAVVRTSPVLPLKSRKKCC